MKITFLVLFIGFCFVNAFAQKQSEEFVFSANKNSHAVKIIFKAKAFVKSEHKIKIKDGVTFVDNQIAFGTDGSIPHREISAVKPIFDGKEVAVSKDTFAKYYNPNFSKDYLGIKLSDDGKSVLVFMNGSDAAGSYQVFWTFRSDGKHSSFSEACSDCDYADFIEGFFNN